MNFLQGLPGVPADICQGDRLVEKVVPSPSMMYKIMVLCPN